MLCIFSPQSLIPPISFGSYSFNFSLFLLCMTLARWIFCNINVDNKLNSIMCNKKLSVYLFSSFRLFDKFVHQFCGVISMVQCNSKINFNHWTLKLCERKWIFNIDSLMSVSGDWPSFVSKYARISFLITFNKITV